jgi:hypothetical protein
MTRAALLVRAADPTVPAVPPLPIWKRPLETRTPPERPALLPVMIVVPAPSWLSDPRPERLLVRVKVSV